MFLPISRIIFDIVTRIDGNLDLPVDQPFDYQLAMDRLREFRAPRDKLRHLCENGSVIRVKKGLYIPGRQSGGKSSVDPLVLSDLIYGPSYVSLETALAHYGLIPERVEEITCITSKRAKQFRTPLGSYSYRPVNERVFSYGVRLEKAKGGRYFLAEPEKALCDRVALIRGLSAARDVAAVLFDELRIDRSALREFRQPVVDEIAARYRRKNVSAFCRWLTREFKWTATTFQTT